MTRNLVFRILWLVCASANNTNPKTSLVVIEGVSYHRQGRPIFDGIDLEIHQGKVTAIMGPSGTGKTTLLRLIGGQIRPSAGRVLVDGEDVHKLGREALFELRKRIGMLFQSGALLADLSVFDNVAFPLREHTNLPPDMIRDLVMMKLEAVGLRGAMSLYPGELSGGMSRRAALARAIALDPSIIMYDEPFAGQDPISMGILVKLIRELNDALHLTSIVVSHDVIETSEIADHIYLLSGGKVVGQGSPGELAGMDSATVRQFMQGLPDGPVAFDYPAPPLMDDLMSNGP